MKTKVSNLNAIICFIIVVFFCILACDNGSVSDSSSVASNGLVKVSLSVDEKTSAGMQKSISVSSDIVLGSLIYKYNAVPQWVGSNIYGAADWTTINYSDGMSLGYFTPGLWKFGVRLIKIVDGNEVIVYEGYSGVESISTSSVAINIAISKIVEQAAKSVTISVTAPTVDGEALNISYTGTASSVQPIPANITGRANGLTTFEYSFSEETVALDSGNYTFTLNHPLGGSGSAVAVDLRPGEQVQITGHLDNGVWHVGAVTVKIHTIDITTNVELCTVYANTTSAAANERVSFYLIPYDGAALKEGTTISVTYVSDPETKVTPLVQDGGMYTFVMPDADVAVNAEYDGVSEDVLISHFAAILKILYNSSITTFGHENTVPSQGVELFRIKYMTLWKSGSKICWHASSPTGKVKFAAGSMDNLFKDCSTFTHIDLTGFDTSQVKSMAHMFDGCTQLQSVNLTGINTSEVKDMSYMFNYAGYDNIISTGKAVHTPNNNPLSITGLDGFDTKNVLNMSHMFYTCSAADLSDVSSFRPYQVRDFSYMFSGKCTSDWKTYWYTKVPELDVSAWDVGKNVPEEDDEGQPIYINLAHMFDMCNELTSLALTSAPNSDTAGWKFKMVNNMEGMFNRCELVTSIVFPRHTELDNVTTLLSVFCRDTNIILGNSNSDGDGSFNDIFRRWDISDNTAISFVSGGSGDTPNRLIQDDSTQLKTASPLVVTSYGTGFGVGGHRVQIGGNPLNAAAQRLVDIGL